MFPGYPAGPDISPCCPSYALQNAGRCRVSYPEHPAGAVSDREIAVRNLHFGMRFAAKLPYRFDDLGHAAAIDRMIAAQAAAIGVEWQLADPGNQVAIGGALAALALLAKSDILELHQHGDGEGVVDWGVFDVLWRHARFL